MLMTEPCHGPALTVQESLIRLTQSARPIAVGAINLAMGCCEGLPPIGLRRLPLHYKLNVGDPLPAATRQS